jgi:hypothetical protein
MDIKKFGHGGDIHHARLEVMSGPAVPASGTVPPVHAADGRPLRELYRLTDAIIVHYIGRNITRMLHTGILRLLKIMLSPVWNKTERRNIYLCQIV